MAEQELEALSSRQEEVEALERDRDALMASSGRPPCPESWTA
jgi:hypothetical protein